jgi:glutamyl-tRNA synthetase
MKVPVAAVALERAADEYESIDWTAEALHAHFMALATELEVSPAKLQGPLRVAVTGRMVGLPLFELLAYLGRDEARGRVQAARARLG